MSVLSPSGLDDGIQSAGKNVVLSALIPIGGILIGVAISVIIFGKVCQKS
jgi:hypothetical protein